MKNFKPYIFIFIFFVAVFFYLYQKVHIYVEAYQLSENCKKYKDLVDKRDHLMFNFSKQVSLTQAQQWAQNHTFSQIGKERLLVVSLKSDKVVMPQKRLAMSFKKFFKGQKSEILARSSKRSLYR